MAMAPESALPWAAHFVYNRVFWAASTIAELYKARWEIEVFFKEFKQTLQLTDFIGTNENAVKECARTKGVGSGERSELRSSLKAPRRYGRVSSLTYCCTTSSSSPDGTRRSRASSGSCVLPCGWIWTSWKPCASMG